MAKSTLSSPHPLSYPSIQLAAGVSTVVAISILLYLSGYVPVVCAPLPLIAYQ